MNSGSMAGSFCVSYQGVEKEVNSQGAKLKKKQFICIPDKWYGMFPKSLVI